MRKNQVLFNMVANIISYSANVLLQFILTPYLIDNLGKETYGFYPIATNIVNYMGVVTNAMNAVASRFVTVSLQKNNIQDANSYYSSAFNANVILGSILSMPLLIVVVFLDMFMNIPIDSVFDVKILFALVFLSALINIVSNILGIATFAKNRIDLRSLRELGGTILKVILFVLLYNLLKPSIVYIGIVGLVIALYNILVQYNYTRVLMPEVKFRKINISIVKTKELFCSSIWTALMTLGNLLISGMSMILSNVLLGTEEAGDYSIVNVVPQFINGVISMLVGVFFPVITYRYAHRDKEGLITEIGKAQNIVGAFGCAVIVTFSALSPSFFKLWTPGEDSEYLAKVALLTIIPHLFISCLWILTNLNIVMNTIKIPAIFGIAFGIGNILVSVILKKMGILNLEGIAIISSSFQIIWISIFMPIYCSRKLNIKWYSFLIKPGIVILMSLVMYFTVSKIVDSLVIDSWWLFIAFGIPIGVVTIIVLFLISGGGSYIPRIRNILSDRRDKDEIK